MTHNGSTIIGSWLVSAPTMGVAAAVALAWSSTGSSQAQPPDQAKHAHQQATASKVDQPLADQVRQLRDKVAKLEAALSQKEGARPSSPMGGGGMGMGMVGHRGSSGGMTDQSGGMPMMGDRGMGMGMMDEMSKGSTGGGQSGDGMGMAGGGGGMSMTDDDNMEMGMMGMGAMGKVRGMGGMQRASALPGFPGASHIYHIGATGFFLDHDQHIALAPKQRTALNQIKQKALLASAKARRAIDEAEQELWTLTGADKPPADEIQSKIAQIEKLRGDQRLAFIRAVGDAAKVLTEEQRRALLGTAPATADQPPTAPPEAAGGNPKP